MSFRIDEPEGEEAVDALMSISQLRRGCVTSEVEVVEQSGFFVHDGINSVADYNSLRVGVGWMSDGWMDVGCRPGANFTIG